MTRWQIIKVLLIVAYRVLVKRDYLGMLRDLVPVAPTETSPLKHHPAAMKFSPELRKMVRGGGVQLLAAMLLAGSAMATGQITVTGFPPVPVTIKGGDGISIAGGVISATGIPAGGVSATTFNNYTSAQSALNAAQSSAISAAAGVAGSALQPGSVVNNLTSAGTAVPLSAEQGKVLNAGTVVDIARFGLPTGGDDASIVQAAINYAVANNIRFIRVSGNYVVSSALTDRANVIFIGNGSLTGSGAYRRKVIPENARTGVPKNLSNFSPVRHLAKLKAAASPVVVFTGDSTFTYENSNSLGREANVIGMLKSKLQQENPDKSFTFYNRAIGAQRWLHFDSLPTVTSYSWYTNPTQPWLDYIEDLAPDTLFIGFGMNDSSSFDYTKLHSAIAKINLWAKVPDIVLVTNAVPTLEPGAGWEVYATEAAQEGRDYAAGFTRSYALNKNYGCLDVNRALNIVRDGRDIQSTYLYNIIQNQDVSATGYYLESTRKTRDFVIQFTINGTSQEILDVFNNVAAPLSVYLGSDSNNVMFLGNSGGKIQVKTYAGSGNLTETVVTVANIPTTNFSMIVEKRGQNLSLRLADGTNEEEIYRRSNIITHGGEFYPRVSYFAQAAGPLDVLNYVHIGIEDPYIPTLTNDEIWGNGEASGATKYPLGSNGINHFTNLGAEVIYGAVLNDVSFSTSSFPAGSTAFPDLTDVPDNILTDNAGKSIQVNAGGSALEAGQDLRTTATPTFAAASLTQADAGAALTLTTTSSTAARFPKLRINNYSGVVGSFPLLETFNARGTSLLPTATQSGDYSFVFWSYGYGTTATKLSGQLSMRAEGNYTDANQPTSFSVRLGKTGGNGAVTERFKIEPEGAVNLPTGTAPASTTDNVKLYNLEGDYLHIMDEEGNDHSIGQKTLSLGASFGGTATLQSTSHATKGALTIPNDVIVTGTINNPASAVDTDATIDTAVTPVAIFTSATTTTLTASNVVAGRCFMAIITSTGGGAISYAGFTPTWMDGAPATMGAGDKTAITCMGTGSGTADCTKKENY